ncbi:type VII toxin-antitoxin system HepT family RNase toxin [Halovivax cerinus]|uniref:DUF86 domain-containing protein n=1 Tax=Halovivax cerinus TaxID=1487865 RepID=A0ABD5NQ16_9EURY|nr:DUF86 domain-containing protein [Halovivax cerinus]
MTFADDDVERIVTAVETIEESLAILAEKQAIPRERYLTETETQDVVERRFVKLTEATLDIARTIVVNESGRRPESNPAAMIDLGAIEVFDRCETAEMAQAARFRNVLAHTYGRSIDHDDVYDALCDLERYRDFLYDIKAYLDETGAL